MARAKYLIIIARVYRTFRSRKLFSNSDTTVDTLVVVVRLLLFASIAMKPFSEESSETER